MLAVAAIACGIGQVPVLDAYGNSTCVQAATGQVREVQGYRRDCPAGMLPRLTPQGAACVQKDSGQPYFNLQRECPIGTAPGLDDWGNETCRRP